MRPHWLIKLPPATVPCVAVIVHSPDRIAKQLPVVAVAKVSDKQPKQQQQHSSLAGKNGSLLVQTSEAHRQAAQAQSAQKALQEASELLGGQLRQMARRSLNAQENKKDQLQQSLHQLKNKLVKLTREAKYEGEQVLHHDLTPTVKRAATARRLFGERSAPEYPAPAR